MHACLKEEQYYIHTVCVKSGQRACQLSEVRGGADGPRTERRGAKMQGNQAAVAAAHITHPTGITFSNMSKLTQYDAP